MMKSTVTLITLCDLLFILLLSVSGSTRGVSSDIIYYLAFIAPVLICIFMSKDRGCSLKLGVRAKDIPPLLLQVPVAISVIVLFAYLTTLLMGAFGFENTATVEGPLPLALLLHALVPSVLEELLFRYVPIRLMRDKSPRVTVLISAILFALCHTNLFQLPYALVGGIILCAVDIAYGSILPSFIIHFINNSLSVITMLYPDASLPVFITLGGVSLLSLGLLLIKREWLRPLRAAFSGGDDESVGYAPIALGVVSLTVAVTTLVMT